jgi:hypothetical protein
MRSVPVDQASERALTQPVACEGVPIPKAGVCKAGTAADQRSGQVSRRLRERIDAIEPSDVGRLDISAAI